MPARCTFTYTFENIANVIDRFTEVIGLRRFAIYVFDYGEPVGFRLDVRHPDRHTAIVSQNGNAQEEGLSDGWNPIRAYLQEPSLANREALRSFLAPDTTIWQYTHGVPDVTAVSPDGYSLDNFHLARPGARAVRQMLTVTVRQVKGDKARFGTPFGLRAQPSRNLLQSPACNLLAGHHITPQRFHPIHKHI